MDLIALHTLANMDIVHMDDFEALQYIRKADVSIKWVDFNEENQRSQ